MAQRDALSPMLSGIVVDDFGAEIATDFFAFRRRVAQGGPGTRGQEAERQGGEGEV